jgi:hypothetical protein
MPITPGASITTSPAAVAAPVAVIPSTVAVSVAVPPAPTEPNASRDPVIATSVAAVVAPDTDTRLVELSVTDPLSDTAPPRLSPAARANRQVGRRPDLPASIVPVAGAAVERNVTVPPLERTSPSRIAPGASIVTCPSRGSRR